MSFKSGDMVVIVRVEGAHYPRDAQPGTIGTVQAQCTCVVGALAHLVGQTFYSVALPATTLCINGKVLRKIDPDGRQVGSWDECPWQPEREKAPA